jgi:S-adenosylmethionine uptake transporter
LTASVDAPPAGGAVRRAAWLIVGATALFATMGVCVKLASATYGAAEIVFYRSLVGVVVIAAVARWQGASLQTPVPWMHAWRSVVGVSSLCLWFYAMAQLPLATAMTLNYMSSVWMVLFLIGGAVMLGSARVDPRLVATVMVGFVGVALILRPTIEQNQAWHGLAGLLSGMLAALAYLQVTALGRAGEPETRVVFYFSLGGVLAGAALSQGVGWSEHTAAGLGWTLLVGLLATAAQLMMTRAYAIGRPLVNASLQYLGIAFSFVLGVLIFNDPVTLPAVLGMLLVVGAGLAAVRLRTHTAPADTARQAPDT